MHFKPFWMPCLHIKFFTSAPIPELTAVENFTKRWNGMLGSLSDFKNQFKSRKVLIRLEWNPSIRNEEKKVLIGSEFMFQEGAKLSKYRFFMLLLLRILVRNKTYMLSDWIFLKNILIGQISSHRCMIELPGLSCLFLHSGRSDPCTSTNSGSRTRGRPHRRCRNMSSQ